MEEERPVTVDRDGGRSPGELLGEKAVGRVETPLIHLGPWEPRRLRRREGRRLATEAPAFLAHLGASFHSSNLYDRELARDLVSKWMEQKSFRPLAVGSDTTKGHWDPGDFAAKNVS